MATMQGITGKLSGKMGSAVFRIREGQQVVTQYNPVVKNPNTEGQQSNRAAFKLMSQLAAIMSPALGGFATTAKSGKGKPTQRNEFLRVNYPLVTTADESTGVVAKIPMEQLDLTGSFKRLGQIETEKVENDLLVSIGDVAAGVTMVRIVAIGYGTMSVIERPARAQIMQLTDCPVSFSQTGGSVELRIPNWVSSEFNTNITILAYGLIPSESGSIKIDLDNIHTPADEDFISAIKLETMISAGAMSVTETIGVNATFE